MNEGNEKRESEKRFDENFDNLPRGAKISLTVYIALQAIVNAAKENKLDEGQLRDVIKVVIDFHTMTCYLHNLDFIMGQFIKDKEHFPLSLAIGYEQTKKRADEANDKLRMLMELCA